MTGWLEPQPGMVRNIPARNLIFRSSAYRKMQEQDLKSNKSKDFCIYFQCCGAKSVFVAVPAVTSCFSSHI
jgi:hypothetical protein